MHIIYISSENPFSNNSGGIAAYCKYAIKMMLQLGNKVSLITIGDIDRDFVYNDVQIYQFKQRESGSTFYIELTELFYKKVCEIQVKEHIDIIECQDWMGIGYKIAQNINIPFVTRLHTPLFLVEEISDGQKIYRYSEQIKEMEKKQIMYSTILSSPCTDLANIIYDKLRVKSYVIPNPIDVNSVCDKEFYETPDLLNDIKYFLYVGRLEFRKGVLVLAKLLDELFNKYPDYYMVLCGHDTVYNKRSVKSMIKEICKDKLDHIIFIDNIDGEEKKSYLANCELVIQPSLWENFSYVTLEAMSFGKRLVCTNTGGFTEMIEDCKSGFLANSNDSISLLEKIEYAKSSSDLKVGQEAKKRVLSKYDLGVLGITFSKFYKNIVEKGANNDNINLFNSKKYL